MTSRHKVAGYVRLSSGPMDGWAYTAADWQTARQAAINMRRTPDQPQGWVLGYRRTDQMVDDEVHHLVAGVWSWQPTSDAESDDAADLADAVTRAHEATAAARLAAQAPSVDAHNDPAHFDEQEDQFPELAAYAAVEGHSA
jgi:hypothetical protein